MKKTIVMCDVCKKEKDAVEVFLWTTRQLDGSGSEMEKSGGIFLDLCLVCMLQVLNRVWKALPDKNKVAEGVRRAVKND